jgi:hypothetical protein
MLIGRLMTQWANCESWFIKLLDVLLRTNDMHRAEIVFYSITTSITRRSLIHRLFMVYVTDEPLRTEFDKLMARYGKATEARNKFAHAQYKFSLPQEMNSIRFKADFDGSKWTTTDKLDKNLRNELKQAVLATINLAYDLHTFLDAVRPKVLEKLPKPPHRYAAHP